MAGDLPEFYFRIKENGAAVFRIDTENRQRRIEMEQIANVNVRNGEIKPHGDRLLTREEIKAIREWAEARSAVLVARDLDDVYRAVDQLNLTTQWAQSRASDEELDEVTDDLLLAMHDLRTVLVRKKSERMSSEAEAEDSEG